MSLRLGTAPSVSPSCSRMRASTTCTRHGADPGGASPLRAGRPEPLADGNCVTARWGGEEALRQTSVLTNRHRIQGRCSGVTRRRMGKPKGLTDTAQVNPAAIEGRSSVLPWEISRSFRSSGAGNRRRRPTGREKSAEAVVCAGQRPDQEGSSPSGARMRSAVSKGGGNASPAEARGRYGEV